MKYVLFVIAIFCFTSLAAQNLQVHYDFGRSLYDEELKGRPKVTTTVEMFRTDNWGNTYFFVDMDYTGDGVASAYWEIARQLRFWETPLAIHVEYNGGLTNQFSLQNAYLLGSTYTFNSSDFKYGFTGSVLYKYIQKHDKPNNFQLTTTWYWHITSNRLLTFSGFADWWREKTQHGNCIFLSEPQIWVNINQIKGVNEKIKFSVGSEIELSHNFGGRDGFYVIPTLAVKWTFD